MTYKGTVDIHDDEETRSWFYPALAARKFLTDTKRVAWYADMLDSPNRVVLRINPTKRVSYDGRKKQGFDDRTA